MTKMGWAARRGRKIAVEDLPRFRLVRRQRLTGPLAGGTLTLPPWAESIVLTADAGGVPRSVIIEIRRVRLRYGRRPFLACPCCDATKRDLYIYETRIACRACHAITYRSRRRHSKVVDRLLGHPAEHEALGLRIRAGQLRGATAFFHTAEVAAQRMRRADRRRQRALRSTRARAARWRGLGR